MVVGKELDRILTLLRNKIREKGFTQLEVQETLGWGRSYISQLLTKQKSLRVEQVLLILDVIGVDPADFFGELYHFAAEAGTRGTERQLAAGGAAEALVGGSEGQASETAIVTEFLQGFKELKAMMRGLVRLLVDRSLITVDDLSEAVQAGDEDDGGETGGDHRSGS